MWRLFFRILPIILVALLSATAVIVSLTSYFMDDELDAITLKQANSHIMLLKDYLNQAKTPQELDQRLAYYQQAHYGEIALRHDNDLSFLSETDRARLNKGETVVNIQLTPTFKLIANFYFRLNHDDTVIYFTDTDSTYSDLDKFALATNLVIVFCVLLFLLLWSSFHWSELKKLISATEKIGAGDFSARAALHRSSSTYPVAYKVNQMATYIEKLVNGQTELIHSVSHELRTPITRLEFGLELLAQQIDNHDPAIQKRLHELTSDINELKVLVNELLRLASIGQQYLPSTHPFKLRQILDDVIKALPPHPEGKTLIVTLADSLGEYQGDSHYLKRAIKNLLTNAQRYARKEVRLNAYLDEHDNYLITIDDDGPDIPIEQREHVFQPFYRIDDGLKKEGYGLGLAMVERIITVHGGKIAIENSPLGGARFTLQLPIAHNQ